MCYTFHSCHLMNFMVKNQKYLCGSGVSMLGWLCQRVKSCLVLWFYVIVLSFCILNNIDIFMFELVCFLISGESHFYSNLRPSWFRIHFKIKCKIKSNWPCSFSSLDSIHHPSSHWLTPLTRELRVYVSKSIKGISHLFNTTYLKNNYS